jgi:hypothetical protein
MTATERQRRRRARLRVDGLRAVWLKGKDGFFDPRFHIAIVVRTLVMDGTLNPELVNRLVREGGRSAGVERGPIERDYMEMLIRRYLGVDGEGRALAEEAGTDR